MPPAETVRLSLVGTLSASKIPKTVSLSVFIFWSDHTNGHRIWSYENWNVNVKSGLLQATCVMFFFRFGLNRGQLKIVRIGHKLWFTIPKHIYEKLFSFALNDKLVGFSVYRCQISSLWFGYILFKILSSLQLLCPPKNGSHFTICLAMVPVAMLYSFVSFTDHHTKLIRNAVAGWLVWWMWQKRLTKGSKLC